MRIEAQHLSKSYGDVPVVSDISFTVCDGQSLAFSAPSGAGKSTLLSTVGLLLNPSSGTLEIDACDVSTLSDSELSLLRLQTFGFVFQHTQLIGSLRAWENVAVPCRFVPRAQLAFDPEERALQLLTELGLKERAQHYPFQLSIGQKRRVALARALIMNPPVLIADEPTNDLDARNAQSVTEALFNHVAAGGILLYATHDEQLLKRATRIIHL